MITTIWYVEGDWYFAKIYILHASIRFQCDDARELLGIQKSADATFIQKRNEPSTVLIAEQDLHIQVLKEGFIQIGDQDDDCHQFHVIIHLRHAERVEDVSQMIEIETCRKASINYTVSVVFLGTAHWETIKAPVHTVRQSGKYRFDCTREQDISD